MRGFQPYYIDLPQIQSILFVTGKDRDGTLHLVNMKTQGEIKMGINGSGFGDGIASSGTPGEPGTDYVTKINENELEVVHRSSLNWKEVLSFSLPKRKLISMETIRLDEHGNATNVIKRTF